MSDTKAAFAERTKRSLKDFLNRYMEHYGYKYIHKVLQFFTTLNSGRNRIWNRYRKEFRLYVDSFQ